MPAIEPLCHLIEINPSKLSKMENDLLEGSLFVRIWKELNEYQRIHYKNYFHIMNFTIEMENTMLENDFISFIIQDILSTGDYTIQGIAYYTDTHEDIIQELASGINTKPLASYLRKIISLHKSVRYELYHEIGKKIILEYLSNSKISLIEKDQIK